MAACLPASSFQPTLIPFFPIQPIMSINGKRLYVGRLSRDATRRDVEDFFAKAGPLIDIRVMQGFGFVEFESPRVRAPFSSSWTLTADGQVA